MREEPHARYGRGMVRPIERPILSPAAARATVEATRDDPLLYAGASLMLWAGLRPAEVTGLLVRDWLPREDPQLTVGGRRERTIRVAPSAAAAVGAYLAGHVTRPDEPLLLGLKVRAADGVLPRAFRDFMLSSVLDVSGHDLRRTAVAVVRDAGVPLVEISAYFGVTKGERIAERLAAVPEGYDRRIAALLEQTFTT